MTGPVGGLGMSALGAVLVLLAATPAGAQIATVGAGALLSDRAPIAVFELHGETPPLAGWRGYATLSWTRQSAAPTVITAVERPVLSYGRGFTGLGAGLLWLEGNAYAPFPILVSSTVLPLPVPRTSFVAIASTQPFQGFAWSLVLKVGITILFVR